MDYTFYFNPMSRGQIARWALHEAGAQYSPVLVSWEAKPAEFLAANPMGKVPTLIHHGAHGDQVITETAAICHYLAEVEAPELLARGEEKAAYFRWLMFAAGPLEAAITAKALGWAAADPRQEAMVGFGSHERVVAALDGWLGEHEYVCGSRFTMADVYLGSQLDWGLQFGTMPALPAFENYVGRLRARSAFVAAHAIDDALIAAEHGSA